MAPLLKTAVIIATHRQDLQPPQHDSTANNSPHTPTKEAEMFMRIFKQAWIRSKL